MTRIGRKAETAALSVASNVLVVAAKGVVGVMTGSMSILAEAVHSMSDLAASLIAFFAVRAADKPPDDEHAFGHGKYENISGTVEAFLIILASIYVAYEAILRMIHGVGIERIGLGMAVMFVTAVLNWFVSARLFKVAEETDSIALEADGHHLRLDVYTSVGVFVGLTAVYLTDIVLIDRLVALGVAVWIAWIGYSLCKRSICPLLDVQLPQHEVQRIEAIIETHESVLGYHKLRTRKSGAERHIDVHLLVPEDMTLIDAHLVGEEIEDKIRAEFHNASVLTHVEPDEE